MHSNASSRGFWFFRQRMGRGLAVAAIVGAVLASAVAEAAAPGAIITFAGNGSHGSGGDGGPATGAPFRGVEGFAGGPEGLAVDSAGNLYIAETFGCRVRKVSGGVITTFAGNGTCAFGGDGGPATSASIGELPGVAIDGSGNLYIVDLGNCRVRKVSGGTITTVAGTGATNSSNTCAERSDDAGPATTADLHLDNPNGIAADAHGNLYITDSSTCRVREVTGGLIETVAGNGSCGYGGDGGPATSASMNNPGSVAIDAAGNLYIADSVNCRIRKVSGGQITTVAGDSACAFSGDGGRATSASLSNPFALTVDASGRTSGSSRASVPPDAPTCTWRRWALLTGARAAGLREPSSSPARTPTTPTTDARSGTRTDRMPASTSRQEWRAPLPRRRCRARATVACAAAGGRCWWLPRCCAAWPREQAS